MKIMRLGILAAIVTLALAALARAVDPPESPATQPATAPSTLPIEPLRLTLHFKDAPVMDVIKAIQWQTGLSLIQGHQVTAQFIDKKTMTIEVDNAPFWDVMRQLNDASGLSVMRQRDNSGQLFTLMPTRMMGIMTADESSDLVTIKPIGAQLNRSMQYSGGSANSSLNIGLRVITDPAIDMARANCETAVSEAVDENGKSLLVPDRVTNQPVPVGRKGRVVQNMMVDNSGSQIWLPLRDSEANGKTIARIEGAVRVNAASPVRQVKILDPAADSHTENAGTEIRVIDFAHKGSEYVLQFQVTQSPAAVKWDPSLLPQNTYSLIDTSGDFFRGHTITLNPDKSTYTLILSAAPVNQGNVQMMQQNLMMLNGNMQVQNGPAPAAPQEKLREAVPPVHSETHSLFIIDVPMAPIDFSVPFELKDLPLP